ncbi:hypothetical protein ACM66B_003072 [Microbotryomycetes sp. NB124-2]
MGKKSKQAQEQDQQQQQPSADVVVPVEDVASATEPSKANKKSSKRKLDKTADEAPQADAQAEQQDNDTKMDSPAAEEDDAEPPLSHKERRLAKRRKLKSTTDDDKDGKAKVATDNKPALKVGATPAKSAFGVWIGNLTYTTTSQQLLAWLAERGLSDVTRVNMPKGKRSHEHNKGYVYVDFATEAERDIAVGLSEQHLDGRKLLIKASTDFTGRPTSTTSATAIATAALGLDSATATGSGAPSSSTIATHAEGATGQTLSRTARKILDRQKNPPGPTLFLGNLGFETTIEDIKELFDAHQRAAAAWTPKKKDAGTGKKDDKKKAKEADAGTGASDDDEADENTKDKDEEDASDAEKTKEEGEDAEEGEKKPKRVRSKKRRKDGEGDEQQQPAPEPVSDAGIKKVRIGTFEDSGKCKGWAFVDFKSLEHATRALLNPRNHTLAGRSLNVEYASLDAVRRGGFKVPGAPSRQQKRSETAPSDGSAAPRHQQRGDKRKAQVLDDSAVRQSASSMAFGSSRDEARTTTYDDSVPPPKPKTRRIGNENRSEGRDGGKRAKPGAALATAQRASEAIVASRGKKVVFE